MIGLLKTAIFGGTFNPPHNGHRVMLQGIAELSEIKKILVMPVKEPPHKSADIASAEHRVNMCRLAFGDIKKAQLDLTEFGLSGKSYTVNTLEYFKSQGIKNPVLIIGGDSLRDFHKWHRYEDILSLAEIYAYRRGGVDDAEVLSAKERLIKKGGRITMLNICPPEISSTDVRNALLKGEGAGDLVPHLVEQYIKEQGLYNGTDF